MHALPSLHILLASSSPHTWMACSAIWASLTPCRYVSTVTALPFCTDASEAACSATHLGNWWQYTWVVDTC